MEIKSIEQIKDEISNKYYGVSYSSAATEGLTTGLTDEVAKEYASQMIDLLIDKAEHSPYKVLPQKEILQVKDLINK